jgi:hypothetical protein
VSTSLKVLQLIAVVGSMSHTGESIVSTARCRRPKFTNPRSHVHDGSRCFRTQMEPPASPREKAADTRSITQMPLSVCIALPTPVTTNGNSFLCFRMRFHRVVLRMSPLTCSSGSCMPTGANELEVEVIGQGRSLRRKLRNSIISCRRT